MFTADSNKVIKFSFSKEKLVSLVQILSMRTPDFDMLKAMKLLYLVDRVHLRRYGLPVLGDHYICMSFGPVPSRAYDLLKDVLSKRAIEPRVTADATQMSTGGYPIFVTNVDFDEDVFSSTELETIDGVIDRFGERTASELVDYSHEHAAWKDSQKNAPIDYTLFFAEEPEECKDAYDAMLIEQDDRDFVDDI